MAAANPRERTLGVLIMGPPGAGKGTQAAFIAREYRLAHLATGDILRKELAEGTALGKKAKEYMEKGALVPDEVMVQMVALKVAQAAGSGGFLLDGFPRTVAQAKAFDAVMKEKGIGIAAVLQIMLPDEVVLGRLGNRLTCPACQATYHAKDNPPKKRGVCDKDGKELYTRADDTEDVIHKRLTVYKDQTAPVIGYYKPTGLVREIDGNRPIDAITRSIQQVLDACRGGRE